LISEVLSPNTAARGFGPAISLHSKGTNIRFPTWLRSWGLG
jgi:hypothetical protein